MKRSTSLLLATGAVLSACSSSPGEGGGLPLRNGVSLVYEGPAIEDPECMFRQTEKGWCSAWTDLVVQDVARDGDRVSVLLYLAQPHSLGVAVAESPDLGKTWSVRTLGSPPTNAGAPSLYLAGGRTFVFWVVWIEAPLGGRPVGAHWELTPPGSATPYVETNDNGMIAQLVPSANGRARAFLGPADINDPSSGFWSMTWAPGETYATRTTLCAGVRNCNPRLLTADGQTYVGTFFKAGPTPTGFERTDACTYHSSGEVQCVPWDTWPAREAEDNDPPTTVVHDSGSFAAARFYAQDGHAFVERLLPGAKPTLAEPLDLGAGRPAQYTDAVAYASGRQRFPGLSAVVRPGGELALYRPRGLGALDAVSFVNSPCTTLEGCAENPLGGYGQATFALPLDGDERLVFYVVDSFLGSEANHQWLYASRESFKYEQVRAESVDVAALYPDARELTPVEAMCLRAAACFPAAGLYLPYCAGFWSGTSSSQPGSEQALAKFLATPAGCDGFASSWPELTVATGECRADCTCDSWRTGLQVCLEDVCGIACTRAGGTCDGSICSLAAASGDCNSCTSDGRAVLCAPDTGSVYFEARCSANAELSCETCGDGSCAPHCADRAACPSDGMRCDGDVAVGCNQGEVSRTDCAATGYVCQAGYCAPPEIEQGCQPEGSRCVGATLLTCPGPQRAWIRADCKALGFTSCGVSPTTGHSQCQ